MKLDLNWTSGIILPDLPPGWEALGEGVRPASVQKFTADPFDEGEDKSAPKAQPHVCYLGGSGSAADRWVLDVRPSPDAYDYPQDVVASALDHLTLPGAMFTYIFVSGAYPTGTWKLVQSGAVNGTPAWQRLTGEGLKLVPTPPATPGGAA